MTWSFLKTKEKGVNKDGDDIDEIILAAQEKIRLIKEKNKIEKGKSARSTLEDTLILSEGICDFATGSEKLFSLSKAFPDRIFLAKYCFELLGAVEIAVEVGVETGAFTQIILENAQPNVMHLFDLNYDFLAQAVKDSGKCVLHRGNSNNLLSVKLDDESINYAYVDGGHGYDCVKKDIAALFPKMRQGGIMQFNDYMCFSPVDFHSYGVQRAVNELINTAKVNVVGVALNSLGHNDIAVQVISSSDSFSA